MSLPTRSPNISLEPLSPARWTEALCVLRGEAQAPDSNHISQTLENLERQKRLCEDELSRLRVEVIGLDNHRQDLQRQIDAYASLNAPIRNFPPEILRQIFVLACDANNEVAIGGYMPAMVLSSVCTVWRNICMDTPELWSRISVKFERFVEDSLMLLVTLLSRSKQSPLTIFVSLWFLPEIHRNRIMAALVNHCHRWQHLELDVDWNPFEIHRLWQAVHGNVPLLEYLHVKSDVLGGVGDVFQLAPKLRSVKLTTICSDEFPLPYEQITTLSIGSNYNGLLLDEMVFSAVRRCPQLQHLQVCEELTTGSADNIMPSTITTNAHTLTLAVGHFFSLTVDYLAYIQMPRLATVKLITYDQKYRQSLNDFGTIDFLFFLRAMSSSDVTTLSMEDITLSSTECVQLLSGIPSLTHFSYHLRDTTPGFHPISHKLFSALRADCDPNKALVPKLHTIKLSTSTPSDCDESAFVAFVDMVMSRYRMIPAETSSAVANLKNVDLRLWRSDAALDQSILAPLRSLAASRRMNITVVDCTGIVI